MFSSGDSPPQFIRPPPSNHPHANLSRDETFLVNLIFNRHIFFSISNSLENSHDQSLLGLYNVVHSFHEQLYYDLERLDSLHSLLRQLTNQVVRLEINVDRLKRQRDTGFRLLREKGLDEYIRANPLCMGGPNPITTVRSTNFCPYCSEVGHFPVNCTRYQCPDCTQSAPGHLPGSGLCPGTRPTAPLPVRPPSPTPTPPPGYQSSPPSSLDLQYLATVPPFSSTRIAAGESSASEGPFSGNQRQHGTVHFAIRRPSNPRRALRRPGYSYANAVAFRVRSQTPMVQTESGENGTTTDSSEGTTAVGDMDQN